MFHSIQGRLQMWYGLILLALLGGFGFTTYRFERNQQLERIQEELHARIGLVLDRFGQARRREINFDEAPPDEAPPPQISSLPDFNGTNENAFYFVIWSRDGRELQHSANAPAHPQRFSDGFQNGANKSELYRYTPPGECMMVGRSTLSEQKELRHFKWMLVEVGIVILAIGMAGGWWTTARALQPIREMGEVAGKIASGELSQRINLREQQSELGRLAAILNSTFARLEAAFAQQGQFTADAAHELRTPVTVILMQTQLALKRERGVAEYQETIAACQRAAQRMKRLLETLLELARWDAGEEKLRREEFELAEVLESCLELALPLAEMKKIRLQVQVLPVKLSGDSLRVAQVITNLLANAIQYTQPGGEVKISISKTAGWARVEVLDNGPGIPEEHHAHVFERFYRADKSRSNAEGRAGLGLAISKTIIEAHNGSISLESTGGQGTKFVVSLPI